MGNDTNTDTDSGGFLVNDTKWLYRNWFFVCSGNLWTSVRILSLAFLEHLQIVNSKKRPKFSLRPLLKEYFMVKRYRIVLPKIEIKSVEIIGFKLEFSKRYFYVFQSMLKNCSFQYF